MAQLADYYRDRAAEYDAVYMEPCQDDLAWLHDLLSRLVGGRRVLEIAAGTGYWTRPLFVSPSAITATDINVETLDRARAREYGPAPVTFEVADAYAPDQVPGGFGTAFIGFFWSHILRAGLPRFLDGPQARLSVGCHPVIAGIVLDNRYVLGSNHPISRTTAEGDTFQRGTLNDGRSYEIEKNFPPHIQFATDMAAISADVKWTELRYFWLATCALR